MMFEKAVVSLIAVSAMCAAAGMAVVAAGFALYAALFVRFGSAWSAALVAVAGALVAAVLAVVLKLRADRRKLHADLMRTNIVSLLPVEVRHFVADRPIATLAISLLSGFLASRNPTLMRELVSVLHSSRRQ